jgi:hypothetical protein
MMIKAGLGLLVSFVLVGCAATGKSFSEFNNLPESKPKPGSSKAIVYRTTDSMMMAARAARIKLNGSEVGACDRGGFIAIDLPPGTNMLSVDIWDGPGICALPATNTQPNSIIYYEVKPRSSGIAAMAIGGLLGGAIEGDKFCSGTFEIKQVSKDEALSKLVNLKQSQQ